MSTDVFMEAKETEEEINVDFYRKIVRRYIELNRFKTAQFWAEKVVTLSKENEQDIYWLALSLFLSKEYQRAAHLIKDKNLHITNVKCGYLAATCLSAGKQYPEAMQILSSLIGKVDIENSTVNAVLTTSDRNIDNIPLLGNSLLSCIHFECGKAAEALENREVAAESFTEALRADIFCYEAFECLIEHQMLKADEEAKLLSLLPINKHCPSQADQELVRYLYESKLNKYRSINSLESSAPSWLVAKVEASLDQKVAMAERYYYNCSFKECYKITKEVMSKDPYHLGCLPAHISCLVESKDANELFLLAHRLVDIYPESGISWFAVGCYYYAIKKSDPARRYLGKATAVDKLFGPAWLAYGHAFALDNEHDQAMAAYFKASQLMTGCHLPSLYVGLENGLTNNVALAENFFLQAHEMAPNDPFVLHEMGVIAFQSEQFDKARSYMEEALSKVKADGRCILQNKWEPLLNNLGHVYRKLQLYEKAIECHSQAMVLMPNSYSTYAAIGFCEVLVGQTKKAVDWFHKALSLKRDDTFSTTMLNYVLELHIQEAKDTSELDLDFSSISQVHDKDITEEDDAALKLIGSTCSEMQTSSLKFSDRSSASTRMSMSMDNSFIDVTNTTKIGKQLL